MNELRTRMREWMRRQIGGLSEDELRELCQMRFPAAKLAHFILVSDPAGAPPLPGDYKRPIWPKGEDGR